MQGSEGPLKPAEPLVYSDRVVAYLDLLGFSNLVLDGRAEDALFALEQVQQTQERAVKEKSKNPEWFDFSMFSDSIAVSIDLVSGDPKVSMELRAWILVNFVRSVYLARLKAGVLVRGAIVRGGLYHEDPIVFGPALVAAYRDEMRAVYPRVVVNTKVVELASALSIADGLVPPEMMFKRDKDGMTSIQMFSPASVLPIEHGSASALIHQPYLKIARQLLENAPDLKAQQKLQWLIAEICEAEQQYRGWSVGPRVTTI